MGNSKLSPPAKSNKHIKQGNIEEVSRLYHCKLFSKSKKSLRKLKLEITSVVKRLGYLDYEWSKTLCKDMETRNIDQLYVEYREVLKQNCRREGQNEVVFHSSKIKSDFLDQVKRTYQLHTSALPPQKLKQLIYECKCFLMVLNWLKRIGTCNIGNQRLINNEDINFKHLYEDKSIYALLIDAATKTYQQYYLEIERPRIIEEEAKQSSHPKQLLRQLIQLKKKTKKQDKEEFILKIHSLLLKDDERMIERNIELIQTILGKGQIFAHLLTIKEIGTFNVQFLWKKFHGNRFDAIFN